MLEKYKNTTTLKKMSNEELKELSSDLRKLLIDEITKHGGHLGSNLSIIELTISLLKNFDYKKSKYLFDTGYQAYTYKFLTDRRDFFENLYKFDGYSIFQEIHEGDPYSGGHTSISAGWAGGYNLIKNKEIVIEIIGDASLATSVGLGGLLNFSPNNSSKKGLFILNDNKEGIGTNKFNYLDWEQISKGMGYEYYKVKDGHDFDELQKAWDYFNNSKKSVFVHVETIKALGYNEIKDKRESVHYFIPDGKLSNNLIATKDYMCKFIDKKIKNKNAYFVIAGLSYPMGLADFIEKYPSNFIDVGISEEIAFVQACALANDGNEVYLFMRPSFFQRCYDQLIHDMVRNNSNMTLLINYFNNVELLGDSHHSLYDINMYISFDNINTYMANSVSDLDSALMKSEKYNGPTIIRFPSILKNITEKSDIEKWDVLRSSKTNKVLISYTNDIDFILEYIIKNNIDITFINAKSLSPIDLKLINSIKNKIIFTYEPIHGNNTLANKIREAFPEINISSFSYKNNYIGKWEKDKILKYNKMDLETIFKEILK